jgi:predicted nucleic acid-binding protein
MDPQRAAKPRVFIDADVLFAGAASPNEHSASLVILQMAELTLIDAIASQQVITEAERNLSAKIPRALPAFQLLVNKCLSEVEDPQTADLEQYVGLATPNDLPILVAAIRDDCRLLATFNVNHYQPGHPSVTVLKPGDLVLRVRQLLASLPGAKTSR